MILNAKMHYFYLTIYKIASLLNRFYLLIQHMNIINWLVSTLGKSSILDKSMISHTIIKIQSLATIRLQQQINYCSLKKKLEKP